MTNTPAHFDEYCMAFGMLTGMGVDLANKILDVIPSEREFFEMKQRDLEGIAGNRHKMLTDEYRAKTLELAKREIDCVSNKNIDYKYFRCEGFPHRLLNAPDAPILLFSTGQCDVNASKIVSVVGTRHATQYGIGMVDSIVNALAEMCNDAVVVSGLAYGIDVAAHKAALQRGIATIGVLAHGLDTIYPSVHRSVAASMAHSGGMLITEYPLGTKIHRGNFLARNRVIAALADCTVVVESAHTGGALVTAAISDSYNREVFAVPGRVTDRYSEGCNNLIRRNKAQIITSGDDLLEVMNWNDKKKMKPQQQQLPLIDLASVDERKLIDLLTTSGATHVNVLANAMSMRIHEIMALLVDMELRGFVRALPGGKYTI